MKRRLAIYVARLSWRLAMLADRLDTDASDAETERLYVKWGQRILDKTHGK